MLGVRAFIISSLLIILRNGLTQAETTLQPCFLPPQQDNSSGSICKTVFINETTNALSSLFLVDCSATSEASPNDALCQAHIDKYNISDVKIWISNLNIHKRLVQNNGNLTHDIFVESAKEPMINSNLIFAEGDAIDLRRLTIRSSSLGLPTVKSIVHNFKQTVWLMISDIKATEGLSWLALNDDQGINKSRLKGISIRSSSFKGINTGAFSLGIGYHSLNLESVDLLGQGIATGAIKLNPSSCERLKLRIDNCHLSRRQLEPNTFILSEVNAITECKSNLSFTFTNNQLDRILPQSSFSNFFNESIAKKKFNLEFHSDPIDCCLAENRWIFDLIAANADSQSRLRIKCIDLDGDIYTYKNESLLVQSCDTRNVFPILTITIVSILLLTGLLAVFSCICIYYVLPRKANVILLNSRTRGETVSYAKTEDLTHLRSGNTKQPGSSMTGMMSESMKPVKVLQRGSKTGRTLSKTSISSKTDVRGKSTKKTGGKRSSRESASTKPKSQSPTVRSQSESKKGSGVKAKMAAQSPDNFKLPRTPKSLQSLKSPQSPKSPHSPAATTHLRTAKKGSAIKLPVRKSSSTDATTMPQPHNQARKTTVKHTNGSPPDELDNAAKTINSDGLSGVFKTIGK